MKSIKKVVIFVALLFLLFSILRFIFFTNGTSLNVSFPTNVKIGETLFTGQVTDTSKICISNAYENCDGWCSVTEKHMLMSIRRTKDKKFVRLFFDRSGRSKPSGGSETYFYFRPSCKEKINSESFRLYVISAETDLGINEVVIGLE